MSNTTNNNSSSQSKQGLERSLINIISITAIFSVVISLLMLFNYIQLAQNNPIESKTLSALVERLSDDPNNDSLKTEIRAFDLMARKAYFTSQWQIKTGGCLLLIGAVILVISLRYYYTLIAKIKEPETKNISQQTNRILSSKWLLGSGGLVIGLAIIASLLSTDQLNKYEIEPIVFDATNDNIEIVDLTLIEEPEKIIKENPTVIATSTPKVAEKERKTSPVEEKPAPVVEVKSKPSVQFPTLAEINHQYNSFRGPLGNGISHAKKIPASWNVAAGTNILWKIKVPVKGFSSPVIWGNKLFVTGANNQERWVYCYNSSNGELIWQQQANNIPGSPATAPKTTDDTGLAAPSVVTDGIHVSAIFGTGDIITFDMNGNRIWAKNLGVPDNHYGHSSSLLSWKEKLIIQYDTNKGGRLLSLNIQTGEVIWDIKRSSHISWASPLLIKVDNKMQVVTSTEPTVAGYDLDTGKELWKIDCMMGEVGPSPAFGNGLVFAANEYATLAAIDPVKGEIVWEDNYYLPEVASPVISDGLLFIATTYGVFACFDVHTHNMYWEAEFDEGFYSTPIIADGKLFAIDMNGVVHIMKVDRELEQIASIPMGETVMTTPAFVDGKIFIRGNEHLFAIGE